MIVIKNSTFTDCDTVVSAPLDENISISNLTVTQGGIVIEVNNKDARIEIKPHKKGEEKTSGECNQG